MSWALYTQSCAYAKFLVLIVSEESEYKRIGAPGARVSLSLEACLRAAPCALFLERFKSRGFLSTFLFVWGKPGPGGEAFVVVELVAEDLGPLRVVPGLLLVQEVDRRVERLVLRAQVRDGGGPARVAKK